MKNFFDITKYKCPISFIKAKILLERINPGEKAILRFKGKDTADMLPKTLLEDGYSIKKISSKKSEIYEIIVQKD